MLSLAGQEKNKIVLKVKKQTVVLLAVIHLAVTDTVILEHSDKDSPN